MRNVAHVNFLITQIVNSKLGKFELKLRADHSAKFWHLGEITRYTVICSYLYPVQVQYVSYYSSPRQRQGSG